MFSIHVFPSAKPGSSILLFTFLLLGVYIVGLALYRLYFSPIAKFPGPKWAALSRWYEFYYEVVRKGQFTFHIQELHKQYGPIIRITPEELHIDDSTFFEELYARGRVDKYHWMSNRQGNAGSIFTTASHELHRIRRAPLNPFFSKKRISDFQPVIRGKIDILCGKIRSYAETGGVFALNRAWTAFAGDVITEYVFGSSYEHLESPDFKETFHEPFMAASEAGHLTLQFKFMHPLMRSLPDWVVLKIQPLLWLIIKLQRVSTLIYQAFMDNGGTGRCIKAGCQNDPAPGGDDFEEKIIDIMEGKSPEAKFDHPTIFHELVKSDLPSQEKTVGRLNDEAQLVVAAGLVTTAWALSVTSFHVINNTSIFQRLKKELEQAIPDTNAPLDWQQVEQLPYLNACMREGIRLSYGVTARNPRLSPKPLVYKGWTIPPRTPVSMTIVNHNHNEEIFPDSHSFLPERWLENKTRSGAELDRYFFSFGKGSRSCLGINLAHAELHMGLAAIFRRFTFELYETDVTDVLLAHDFFLPCPKLDSKGVRVKVKA